MSSWWGLVWKLSAAGVIGSVLVFFDGFKHQPHRPWLRRTLGVLMLVAVIVLASYGYQHDPDPRYP